MPHSREKHVRDIVLAGERAGVGDRKLARGVRTSELVGENGFAARRGAEREPAQPIGVAHGFEKQHVAVDPGIVERRRADLAEREIDLVADRNQRGKVDAARAGTREDRADHAARVRGDENAAHRQAGLIERRIGGEHRLAAQVDDAKARRSDHPDAGLCADLAQPRLARQAFGAVFGKAVCEDGRNLHAEPAALGDGFHRCLGSGHDIGVVGRLRQRRERRPGALAQHTLAPRIDRIDLSRIARLP